MPIPDKVRIFNIATAAMQKPFIINIPQPCDEDWAQMTPDGQGRYCSHCQKSVIDFTTWSNAHLHSFFKDRKAKVCGKMGLTQLNVPILPPPKQQTHLYRMAVALGLTLIFSGAGNVVAHPRAPYAFAPSGKHKEKEKTGSDTTTVRGAVYSKRIGNTPVKGANVQLMIGSELIHSCFTDSIGAYSILDVAKGSYNLWIECYGYEPYVRIGVQLPTKIEQYDTLAAVIPAMPSEDTMNIQLGGIMIVDNSAELVFDTLVVEKKAPVKKSLKEKSKKDVKPKRK